MKKLLLICMLVCCVVPVFAGEKKERLDLEIVNDPRHSNFYFNASATLKREFKGQPFTCKLDIDLRKPKNGTYGLLTFHDDTRDITYSYAITDRYNHPTALSKGIVLTSVNGSKGKYNCNVSFERDGAQNLHLLFFEHFPFMDDSQIESLNFKHPHMRVPPRVKSAEELKREEMQKEREMERERQKEEKRAERRLENEIGDMIGVSMVLFALIMMWRAIKRRRLTQLILFTFLGLISTFPPFLFLPILPVYFWWYYQLFKDTHDNTTLESRFGIALFISWVFFAVLFHSIFGGIAIVYAIIWAIACFFAYRLIYMHKMYASRCDYCNYYGPNTIIDKEFIREQIRQTVTRSHTLEDRVETEEQITEWYRTHYDVEVKTDQLFRYYRYCPHCGSIFTSYHHRTKTIAHRRY